MMAPATATATATEAPARRDAHLQALVDFQVARLMGTYADLRGNPRYELLSRFFFEDVYSTEDKSERDDQFKALYESFRRRFGEQLTRGVGQLVALNDLSNALDLRMAEVLRNMAARRPITDEDYEEAYRRCDNYDVRLRQIEMLLGCIGDFKVLSEHLYIGLALKAVKAAASLFGGHTVIGFLDRGYDAYRSVTRKEIEVFRQALEDREMERLDRIYGRRPSRSERGRARGR